MKPTHHPFWCDPERCTAEIIYDRDLVGKPSGEHRSTPLLLIGTLWRSQDHPLRMSSVWLTSTPEPGSNVVAHFGPSEGPNEVSLSIPVRRDADTPSKILADVFSGIYIAFPSPEPDPSDA